MNPTTADEDDIWAKAIRAPDELTDEEKRQITRWPTAEVIEENVRRATNGGTREELARKAAHDPDSLTYPECRLLWDNFHIMTMWEADTTFEREWALPEEEESRRQTARQGLMTPDEYKAMENAIMVYYLKHAEYFDPIRAARAEARTKPPPWVQKLIDNPQTWGYVLYHTQELCF